MSEVLTWSLVASVLYMTLVFVEAMRRRDNSIVDIAWGLAFVLQASLVFALFSRRSPLDVLLLAMVFLWAIRLSLHIALRRRGEDFRYAAWRKAWGRWFVLRSYVQVFLLQAVLAVAVASPVLIALDRKTQVFGGLAAAGIVLWTIGFAIEAIADAQLVRFKRAGKGKLMTTGLWRYSRHPNYFGEALLWWGVGVLCYALTQSPWCFAGPLLITVLLRWVSGVPMLEAKYAKRKDFQAYAAVTNAFIPWFPQRK